jgi:hypothetical protein
MATKVAAVKKKAIPVTGREGRHFLDKRFIDGG